MSDHHTRVSCDRSTRKHQQLQPRRVLVYPRLEQRKIITWIGYLNCCSIGNKYSVVSDCITSRGFSFFVTVETWHESADCPSVIACIPGHCIEHARNRPARDALNTKTNHGGICLFHRTRYTVRHLKLPSFKFMEQMTVQIQGSSVNFVLVIVYRLGSKAATSVFFDDFANRVERLAVYMAPVVVVGNIKLYLEDQSTLSTVKFQDILDGADLIPHAVGPTHRAGHTLDVVISQRTTRGTIHVDPSSSPITRW